MRCRRYGEKYGPGTDVLPGKLRATLLFFIKVRNSKVFDITLDNREITQNDKPLDPSRYSRYDMSALMDDIETFLEEDAEPGRPRTYSVATFDPLDGHLVRYVRRVMGTSERIEINVQLKKLQEPRAVP